MHALSSQVPSEGFIPPAGSRTCFVCRSPHRQDVEAALARDVPATEIVRNHLPDGARLSARNILEHRRRGHLPRDAEHVQQARDEARGAVKAVIELGAVTEGTRLAIAEEIVRLGVERLLRGEIQVTTAHLIRASRVLVEYEIAEREMDRGVARKAVDAIIRHAKSLMTEEDRRRFVIRVLDDPATPGLRELGGVRL